MNLPSYDCVHDCAHDVKEHACTLLGFLLCKARGFNIFDFTAFKVALVSFGVILGAQFSKFFKRHRIFVLSAFVISYCFLIWRIFFSSSDD